MKLLLNPSDPDSGSWLDQAVLESLQQIANPLGKSKDVVEVVLVKDEFIRRINRDYRGVDRATDVVAFSYLESDFPCEDNIAGELYVSFETVEKEAREQTVDPRHLFFRVVLHGLLHILGYDHETEMNGCRMEAEERRVLRTILDREAVETLF